MHHAKRSRPIVLVVAVVVLIAAGFAVMHFTKAHSHAKAGDCVTVQNDTDVAAADCAGAAYQVGKVLAGAGEACPGGEESDYYEVTDPSGRKMCLLPKVAEGACFELDGTFGQKNCTGEHAAKVVKVVAGKADESACGEGGALVFAEPPTTMCLHLPQTQ